MRLSYQRRSESHPTEVEINSWPAWREFLWSLGCGVYQDDRLMEASWAEAWRKMLSGEVNGFCLGVARGPAHFHGQMTIEVIEK